MAPPPGRTSPPILLLNRLRRSLREGEIAFIVLAMAVGAMAGLTTAALGALAHAVQHRLFDLPPDATLSTVSSLAPWHLLMLPLGGALLVLFRWLVRSRRRALVDVVEANALHGGRMSMADSAVLTSETLISNGFGASVGLEAGYAQLGGAFASWLGQLVNLRRADLRTLVGAGTGAAIAAAFGAPLAGSFYAFEIVIGAYTPSAIAPIAAACLTGASVAHALNLPVYAVMTTDYVAVPGTHYLVYALLGFLTALVAIVLMRAVTFTERSLRALPVPTSIWPIFGGLLLMPLAAANPQVLSSGHGALHLDIAAGVTMAFLVGVLVAKCAAVIVSLGFGFRGGLFFASLFIGTLFGHLFAWEVAIANGYWLVAQNQAAVVGMAAMTTAIIGAPMTMALLVLEATRDFYLTGAVLVASLVASLIVRSWFGYSFSTWRLHLRGESVRSARDVGWVRALTAARLMRPSPDTVPADQPIAAFRRRFPLGAASRVVMLDAGGGYAGMVVPAAAYADGVDATAPIASVAAHTAPPLAPGADARTIMAAFDAAQADDLAVADADGRVVGVISEKFLRRRYAEEMEKAQRGLFVD